MSDLSSLPAVLPADEPRRSPTPLLDVIPVAELTPRSGWRSFVAVLEAIDAGIEYIIGLVSLPLILAAAAALPMLQLFSLGYLLESSGRVAKSGRLRDGFIGIRAAGRLGGIVAAVWLALLPLRLVSSLAISAELLEPGGWVAKAWRVGLIVGTALVGLHLALALMCGGRLRYFLVPFLAAITLAWRIMQGGYYAKCRDAVWEFAQAPWLLAIGWLGLRGFAGAFLWLVLPISLIAVGRVLPAVGFLGAFLLMGVLMLLPFLQVHFAARNDLRAFLDVGGVVRRYFRAPWAWLAALIVTLAFALPLYLLKIEMIPREAAWLPSVVFIAFIFPARLLTGWAYGCAEHRLERPRSHWFFWISGALLAPPALAFYVLIVFFTQYTSWNGIWSLYEQHAFLLPVPFLGM